MLNLATEFGNVSKACKVMGLSRDTFYRYQNAIAEGGIEVAHLYFWIYGGAMNCSFSPHQHVLTLIGEILTKPPSSFAGTDTLLAIAIAMQGKSLRLKETIFTNLGSLLHQTGYRMRCL